jgi:hypoxanthine phosphoribosyltransferase
MGVRMSKSPYADHRPISVYLTDEDIAERTKVLGREIAKEYQGKKLVIICVLKGSFIFTADLIRQIDLPLRIEFIAVRSYEETKSTGTVQITQHLTSPIDGEDVLLVEDIVDTGITSKFLLDLMQAHNPASLRLCSLLHKPSKMKTEVPIDFLGFTIPDIFVVGYGLDHEQLYRDLPYIGVYDVEPRDTETGT